MNDSDMTLAQLLAKRDILKSEIGRYKTLVLMAQRWAKRSEKWKHAWHPVRMMAVDGQKMATAELADVEAKIKRKQKSLL